MTLPSRITDTDLADLPLGAGLDALLTELLEQAPTARPRWPLVVAAAASVAAVVAVPTLVIDGGRQAPVSRTSAPAASATQQPTTTPPAEPVETGGPVAQDWVGPSSYAVLEADGWTVAPDEVNTEVDYGVSVTYVRGRERLTLAWTIARWYRDMRDSALGEGPSSPLEVLGQRSDYVVYESQQQMAYLPVVDGYGLRVDAAFTTPDTFLDLVTRLRPVDQAGFSAAMPDAVVTPDEATAVATQMYDATEHPGPVGFPAPVGFNSRYAVAAQVVAPVGCAWLKHVVDARELGDDQAQASAVRGLRSSRQWAPIVDDLRQPDWFAGSLEAIDKEAPDDQVLGSGGCPGGRANSLGSGAENLTEALAGLDLPELPTQSALDD